jgi:hypothetical protein
MTNDRRLLNRSNTPEAKEKLNGGRLSLFDAVPFLACPLSRPRTGFASEPLNKQKIRRAKKGQNCSMV